MTSRLCRGSYTAPRGALCPCEREARHTGPCGGPGASMPSVPTSDELGALRMRVDTLETELDALASRVLALATLVERLEAGCVAVTHTHPVLERRLAELADVAQQHTLALDALGDVMAARKG